MAKGFINHNNYYWHRNPYRENHVWSLRMSKRSQFYNYYSQPKANRSIQLFEKASATASSSLFKGTSTKYTIVVRADLNGYSKWIREKGTDIKDRVELLDDYFSHVVSLLPSHNGIYFRDEGDCLVILFSPYFHPNLLFTNIMNFCEQVVQKTYGTDKLTAKCCVAAGEVTYYQKGHEEVSGDWSAEGDPFVHAARLEAAVDSKPRVYYFEDFFKAFIHSETKWVQPGEKASWKYDNKSYTVPGLGLQGGKAGVSYVEPI